MRKTSYFLNPDLPVTCEGLVAAIQAARPATLAAVSYTLKLLAQQASGIEALKSIRQVDFTGSPCPDDLGDRLTEQGVNLAAFIGVSVMISLLQSFVILDILTDTCPVLRWDL